ncbi:hypothetical protein EMCRGX_G015609 [Ephydatia muelleri]
MLAALLEALWNVPSVGECSGFTLILAQGPPGPGLSCLTSSSSGTCGPFTVNNTPPLTNNVYCLTSTLSVVVTSAMNGLVVSCSSYSQASATITPVGNATISVVAAPSAPTITSLISTYSDQLTVTWTSVPTATSYNVSINDSVNTLVPIPSTGAPQYTFTGLTNNTVYTVSVVAINCAGSSSPATMTNRTTMLESQYGMYHQWVCAQDPHSYWHKLGRHKVNLVSVVNLQVAHVDPSHNEWSCSTYSPISFTTTPVGNSTISVVAASSAPTITSLISTYLNQLTVTWTSVPTATSYNVSINDSVNTLVPIPSTGASQYTFTGLTNNTVYTVSVVAINCAGSSSPATMTNRTSKCASIPLIAHMEILFVLCCTD